MHLWFSKLFFHITSFTVLPLSLFLVIFLLTGWQLRCLAVANLSVSCVLLKFAVIGGTNFSSNCQLSSLCSLKPGCNGSALNVKHMCVV